MGFYLMLEVLGRQGQITDGNTKLFCLLYNLSLIFLLESKVYMYYLFPLHTHLQPPILPNPKTSQNTEPTTHNPPPYLTLSYKTRGEARRVTPPQMTPLKTRPRPRFAPSETKPHQSTNCKLNCTHPQRRNARYDARYGVTNEVSTTYNVHTSPAGIKNLVSILLQFVR